MLTRLLAAVVGALLAAGAAGQTQSLSCIYQNYITEYRVPGEVADVELDEDLAYVIYGENADGHLRIVDVTDLDDIVTIADLELPYTPRGGKADQRAALLLWRSYRRCHNAGESIYSRKDRFALRSV